MLKEHKTLIRYSLVAADLMIILFSFGFAYWFRSSSPFFSNAPPIQNFIEYFWLCAVSLPVFGFFIYLEELYKSQRTLNFGILIWRLIKVILLVTIVLGTLIFIFKAKVYSRSLFGLFILFSFILLILERSSIKIVAHSIRRRGYNFRNILIIGINETADKLVKKIRNHPEWSFVMMGILGDMDDQRDTSGSVYGLPYLGSINELHTIIENNVIDEVIICAEKDDLSKLDHILHVCEEVGIRTHIVAQLFNLLIARAEFDYLEEIPLLTFSTTPGRELHLALKRLLDIFISLFVLIVSLPLFFLIAVLIKIDAKGPVLFKQTRIGLNGRQFVLLKFRSMILNAEEQIDQIKTLNEMQGPVFKSAKDPRITRMGKYLRKFSLDELPQFFNVLKGDMSIVGPRPPIPKEVQQYARWQRRRLSMKPGITCIWQISGRNEIDFEEWMKMDLQYIDNWSLALDLIILIKTIPAVLTAKGVK